MSCKYCSNHNNIENIKIVLNNANVNLVYCPICGEEIKDLSYQDDITKMFYNALKALNIKMEYVTIDGELFLVDREIPKKEKSIKVISHPIDMKVDLNKINIDKEMEMLKKLDDEKKEREAKEARSIIINYFNKLFGVE